MGKFLFVGMIVLLLAMLANMFFQIPALALTISALVDRRLLAVPVARRQPYRDRRRDQLHHGDDRRLYQPVQHLRKPAVVAHGVHRPTRLS